LQLFDVRHHTEAAHRIGMIERICNRLRGLRHPWLAACRQFQKRFSRFARLPIPQPHPVDVCDLVRQVQALYTETHPAIQLDVDLPAAPVEARWDGDMIKRALINFVDNAISAIEGQGHIRLGLRPDDERLRLEVEDDGSGVPEPDRDRLFEPYFSTKKKGTGLGLAIVRRIAQDHGGDARYEPLARGSLFILELPASV